MNGPQRLALAGLQRRRRGAVEAEDPAHAAAAEGGACSLGIVCGSSAAALEQAPSALGGRAVDRQAVGLAAAALGRLDDAVLEAAAPDDEAQRAAEQLGVGQLLPRPRVALVVEGLDAGRAQLLVEAVGDVALFLPALGQRDQCAFHGASASRPDDPALVGELLDRRGDDPRRADPVAAHHDRVRGAGLVEVGRAERLRVAGAELEDVADLDRGLDLDRAAAGRGVAGLDRADVGLVEVEVAAGAHAAQVGVGLVGAGDEGVALDRRVLDDPHVLADRADEADGAEVLGDLLLARRAKGAFDACSAA